jgi:hypothetical protein
MIDRQTLDEALSRHSTFKKAPPGAPLPDRTPIITEAMVKENLRRVPRYPNSRPQRGDFNVALCGGQGPERPGRDKATARALERRECECVTAPPT